jgi:hypothetical protein
MFGLPVATTLLLVVPPLIWVIYTLGFLALSRNWDRQASEEDDRR